MFFLKKKEEFNMCRKLFSLILVLGIVSVASACDYQLDGDLTDSSAAGYGGTGTMENGNTAVYATGVGGVGQALVCDPADGDGYDKVQVSLDVLRQCTTKIAVELWQYGDPGFDSTGGWNCIFQAYNDDDEDHSAGVYGLINSHLPFMDNVCWFASGAGGSNETNEQLCAASTAAQTQGTWSKWTFTKDTTEDDGRGNLGATRIYLNDVLFAEALGTATEVFVDAGAYGFGFGAGVDGGGAYTGMIDNFKIYGVPEPATIALLGLGGLALLRRRK